MEFLVQLIAICTLLIIYLATLLKILVALLKIIALPTRAGLIYLETIFTGKFFKINKSPRNGNLKLISNICLSSITIIFFYSIDNLKSLVVNWGQQSQSLELNQIVSLPISILILFCLIVFYTLNYFSEESSDDTLTKLEKIDFKDFFK